MIPGAERVYADVIIPLALPRLYTYEVPRELQTQVTEGKRAVVQFGKQKLYSALIRKLHNTPPGHYDAKPLLSVLDDNPVVSSEQFELWEWISNYYMCTLGEVMAAALPPALKLESETRVALHPEFQWDLHALDLKSYALVAALEKKDSLSLDEVSKLTGRKNVFALIRLLIEQNIIINREELEKIKQPPASEYVRLHPGANDAYLEQIFINLEKRAPAQLHLLMSFLKLKADRNHDEVKKAVLMKMPGCTNAALQQLIKKNVLQVFSEDEYFHLEGEKLKSREFQLSDVQQNALDQLKACYEKTSTVLLHGVTSSGKTELYIRLIEEEARKGKQVLYLLPEIALTTQIIHRLKKHFGDNLLVYHSRFNERERYSTWNKMQLFRSFPDASRYQVIIGARSAIFLPFSKPGLIIVDEEHDHSFKQSDPAPRYHARDTAIMLSKIFKAKVLLGSATPSIDSYHNAQTGKYGLVTISERFAGLELPSIRVIDLKDAMRRKKMRSFFSEELILEMSGSLGRGEQVILFQNRRGFAPMLECRNCRWIPHCMNCDVTLTYHRKRDRLICHYCGFSTEVPAKCSACGDTDLRMAGYGTERIEDEITLMFPGKKVARLDLDSTRSKSSYRKIISDFENRETDILVGTQMVTKGLDFDHVSLVGILNADNLFNFPHYRASERAFQLMAQVSGRAGRKFKQGKVIIQSWNVDHPVLAFVVNNDYQGFYEYEWQERQRFNYPPACRMTELRMRHRNEKYAEESALLFSALLKKKFGQRVLGPVIPPVAKIRNYYQRNILLKTERSVSSVKFKSLLLEVMDQFKQNPDNRALILQADVDPL